MKPLAATVERKHPRLNAYFLKADFDGSRKQEATWYERMEHDRAASVQLNGRTVAGTVVACWPFPLEKCMRLVFQPDERQEVPLDGAPVEKAATRRTAQVIVANTWYSIDLPAPTPKQGNDFDQALHRALHS